MAISITPEMRNILEDQILQLLDLQTVLRDQEKLLGTQTDEMKESVASRERIFYAIITLRRLINGRTPQEIIEMEKKKLAEMRRAERIRVLSWNGGAS